VAIGALAFSDDSSGVVELIGAASASAGVFIALALALTRGEAWRVFKDAAGLLRA